MQSTGRLTTGLFATLRWMGILLLAWLILIVGILTPVLNLVTPILVERQLGRPLELGLLLLDPFAIALRGESIALTEQDGTPRLSVEDLTIDLQVVDSLLGGAVVIREVTLREVAARPAHHQDSLLAWEVLAISDLQIDPGEQSVAVASLTLDGPDLSTDFVADETSLTTLWDDLLPPGGSESTNGDSPAWSATLAQLSLNDGALSLTTDLLSPGFLHVAPIALQVERLGWPATAATELALQATLGDTSQLQIGGQMHLGEGSGNSTLAISELPLEWFNPVLAQRTAASIHDGDLDLDATINWRAFLPDTAEAKLALEQFAIGHVEGQRPMLSNRDLKVSGLALDATQRRLNIDRLDVVGLQGDLTIDKDGSISLTRLLPPSSPDSTTDSPADEAPAWSVDVNQLSVSDSGLAVSTDLLAPEVVDIAPIDLQLDRLQWPANDATGLSLQATLGDNSQLDIAGNIHLADGVGESTLQLSDLPLDWFDPLVIEQTGISLRDGKLDLDSRIGWSGFLPEMADANLQFKQLAIARPADPEPMLSSRSLRISDINLDATAQQLNIARVDVNGLAGAVHIYENGTINLLQLLGVASEVEEDSELYAAEIAAAEGETEVSPWAIRVGKTSLADGIIDFRDDTLPIDFTAHVEDLEGELSDFDTRTDTEATFLAIGNINGYSPVNIEGRVGHFSDVNQAALRFTTRGVDLGRLTPYSATYANYPIERGVLALDLDYTVVDGAVRGDNHVRIDQLALGERQASDQSVVDLPLQTAVALLSDAAGVIDLSLPVSGTLDDPEFSVWSAAGKAAFNLMSNLIAAPFKFLASLVGGDNLPERLVFAPGDTALAAEVEAALTTLADALAQRPRIGLRLTPHVDPTADRQALRRQRFREQLLTAGLPAADIDERTAAWAELIGRLATEAGLEPDQPPAELRKALITAIDIPDEALDRLANARATEVKRYLVETGGLDPQRAAIAARNENADKYFAGVAMEIRVR